MTPVLRFNKLTPETIGKRIRRRRIERGLSQRQLGKAVGLSQQGINKIEQGHGSCFIEKTWATLGLDLAELDDAFPSSRRPVKVLVEVQRLAKRTLRLCEEHIQKPAIAGG